MKRNRYYHKQEQLKKIAELKKIDEFERRNKYQPDLKQLRFIPLLCQLNKFESKCDLLIKVLKLK